MSKVFSGKPVSCHPGVGRPRVVEPSHKMPNIECSDRWFAVVVVVAVVLFGLLVWGSSSPA